MITAFEKIRTVAIFIVCLLLMAIKSIAAPFLYPIAYLLKDKIYSHVQIENGDIKNLDYHLPPSDFNWFLWFFWLFLDDHQPIGYASWYPEDLLGHKPENKWQKFYVCYRWSAIRNPAFNVNYAYLSVNPNIICHEKVFGRYKWNRKIRTKNEDNGVQFVWFKTEEEQVRFLFSSAILKINLTFFFGWNIDYDGRITLALRFRDEK